MNRTIYSATIRNRTNTDCMNVIITAILADKYRHFIRTFKIVSNSYKLTPLKDILIFMGDNI